MQDNVITNEQFKNMKKRIAALEELKDLTYRLTEVMYELEMRELYFDDKGKTKFKFDRYTIEN